MKESYEIWEHKNQVIEHRKKVKEVIDYICSELQRRAEIHDESKLEDLEAESFAMNTPHLKASEFMSDEYKLVLSNMSGAIKHHYANNRHHPEHFDNGVQGMNLIDVVEMVADWMAASKRQEGGNALKEFSKNKKRFKINKDLSSVIMNTMDLIDNRR